MVPDIKTARWLVMAIFVFPLFTTWITGFPRPCLAEDTAPTVFTLESAVDQALRFNTRVLSTKEAVVAAQENEKRQFTSFLPRASARYAYTHLDDERTFSNIVTSPQNQYRLTATVDQPIFTGFSTITQYRISGLNLEKEKLLEKQTRQDIVFQVTATYFELLQREKLEIVAQQAVKQLEAHLQVAQDFYSVGMIPRNDVLQAEVELANARQELVIAGNQVLVAKSRFNSLLRRPVDAPLEVEDVLFYEPFTLSYDDAVSRADSLRTEILLAEKEVQLAEKDIDLSKREYYPTVDFQANYYRTGDDPLVDGGAGVSDRDQWDLGANLSWTFWEWGKTRYGVAEKRRRLEQAKLAKTGIQDSIYQEIKEAYLGVKGAENNILTAEKAVEQAVENLRINEERYKEQVATSTDVLDAQTLLTKTRTNYFNALSAFSISKATLDRAMGIAVVE